MSFGLPSSSGFCYSQISNLRDENVPPQPQNGGLMTAQDCQNLAKNIIKAYDSNADGICETMEVAKWMVDCYRSMNRHFQPTATDIASYMQIVDRKRTGKISVRDLEEYILQHFEKRN